MCFAYFLRKEWVRNDVSISFTSMRRKLSGYVAVCYALRNSGLFNSNLPSLVTSSVARLNVFELHSHRELTSGTNMDLSDMRKKYKGDEEVSCIQGHVNNLFQVIICQTLKVDLLRNGKLMMNVQR